MNGAEYHADERHHDEHDVHERQEHLASVGVELEHADAAEQQQGGVKKQKSGADNVEQDIANELEHGVGLGVEWQVCLHEVGNGATEALFAAIGLETCNAIVVQQLAFV